MSERFPQDAPLARVVCEGNHIALARDNGDGTRTPMTLPNHRTVKGATLRTVLRQSGIDRDAFLAAYVSA